MATYMSYDIDIIWSFCCLYFLYKNAASSYFIC